LLQIKRPVPIDSDAARFCAACHPTIANLLAMAHQPWSGGGDKVRVYNKTETRFTQKLRKNSKY
jgi:hypothetical protein